MDRWAGKVAVVTGASAGIGLAIAKALLREGMIVVGLARRKAKMEMEMKDLVAKGGKFFARQCDVSNEEEVLEAFRWIKQKVGVVQVLINNAGLAINGKFIDTPSEKWKKVVNVNLMGSLYCSQPVVKMMKETDVEGHIVNINSIFGHRVHDLGINVNTYPVSKHGITALTEILQRELSHTKIRVTSISPGLTKSDLLTANHFDEDLSKAHFLESEDVANSILYIVGMPPHAQVTQLTVRPMGEIN